MPVIQINIASKRRSSIEVRRLADDVLKDRLSQVPGVAAVTVTGGDVREIRVEVDKSRLAAYNISISQIVSALQQENLNMPSGTIKEDKPQLRRAHDGRVHRPAADPQRAHPQRQRQPESDHPRCRDGEEIPWPSPTPTPASTVARASPSPCKSSPTPIP